MSRGPAVAAGFAVLVLAGCGNGLSPFEQRALLEPLDAARAAAADGRDAEAMRALDRHAARTRALRDADDLSPRSARRILAEVDAARTELEAPAAPTATATATPAETATPTATATATATPTATPTEAATTAAPEPPAPAPAPPGKPAPKAKPKGKPPGKAKKG